MPERSFMKAILLNIYIYLRVIESVKNICCILGDPKSSRSKLGIGLSSLAIIARQSYCASIAVNRFAY